VEEEDPLALRAGLLESGGHDLGARVQAGPGELPGLGAARIEKGESRPAWCCRRPLPEQLDQ
jgi:hypothetical protein